jgi:DNA-directed RNA polymerase specialized sigma24 family protein
METNSEAGREHPPTNDELIQRVVEPVPDEGPRSATAERMARLAADQDLIRKAEHECFTGPAWKELSTALAQYGYAVMGAWIRTGRVFRECRDKNIHVDEPPMDGFRRADAEELVMETVAIGLTMFQNRVLATGRWDPTRGASLTTFFIGQCLIQFPTVYRKWSRTVRREAALQAALAASRPDFQQDPAVAFELGADKAELLNQIPDPLTRDIATLRYAEWSHEEISEALGITVKAIESRLYRLRQGGTGE